MRLLEIGLPYSRGSSRTRGESFLLLLRIRLKSIFFCLSCMVVFVVMFLVAVIDSYCQSIHVLE